MIWVASSLRAPVLFEEKTMSVHKRIAQWGGRYRDAARAISSILCLLAILLAISLVANTSSAAAQNLVRLDALGGSGGNDFEHICGLGRVLIGVRGYTGVWIDNVQAVCARVNDDNVSDAQPEGQVFGGNRPLTSGVNCPGRTVIAGLTVNTNRDKPFLGFIAPLCADFFTANILPNPTGMRGTGLLASERSGTIWAEFVTPDETQKCPAGTVAVGIRGRAGQFLDALGLICGPKPAPPDLRNYFGKDVSFRSSNFPDRYIRHKNSLGFIEPIPDILGKKDATFKIVPGLAGRCASFESYNYPGHFLRHQGFRLKLAKLTNDPLFGNDATFCPTRGLADANGFSFESANFPGHYIRHSRNELWVHRLDNSDLFRKDATFVITPPSYADGTITRAEVGQPRADRATRPTEASRPAPPYIIAQPFDVIIPFGQTVGKTTLTWDGGNAHPFAEVWVKIDDADETFMVEQGKGTREVTIEPRKTYLFILTDAGQRLATVTVRVRTP